MHIRQHGDNMELAYLDRFLKFQNMGLILLRNKGHTFLYQKLP